MAKKTTSAREPAQKAALADGYSYDQVRSLVLGALEARLSVLVRGHPGIGKSALAKELSTMINRPLIDIRLAQRDPADLGGVYFPDREKSVLRIFPPDWVRQACDSACFVFLDEINAAVTKLHQAVAYQIVLERRIGPFQFHPDTVVMAAGNLEEDRAIVTPLSSALCNRFVHLTMRPDVQSWIRWGQDHGINEKILAFVKCYGEEVLYKAGEEYAFPTPRSWEMASRMMEKVLPDDRKTAAASCVGIAMAEKLFAYFDIFRKVDAEAVIRKGLEMDFTKGQSSEPSFVYAAVFAVAAFCSSQELEDNELPNIVRFLKSRGLDPEYKFLFLRHVASRCKLLERMKPLKEYQQLAGQLVSSRTSLYR